MDTHLLQNNIFFNTYTMEQINELIESNIIQFKKYRKGETIHNAGEDCTRLDILLSGSLSAYNLTENGSEISVFTFAENSFIGCNLLFSNKNKYPLNIYCTSDSYLAFITIDDVSKLISINNNFAMAFIRAISNYSINLNSKMLTFSHKTLRERIFDYLEKEMALQNSNKIKLSLTKKQLADELGVQRPSLFRELKNLREEGLIDYDSKYITILIS